MLNSTLNREDILVELQHTYDLRDEEIYLLPLLPAIEIAWIGERPSQQAYQYLMTCGQFIRNNLSHIANNIQVVSETQLIRFLYRYLCAPTQPRNLREQSSLALACIHTHSEQSLGKARHKSIWHQCYQVACCKPEHTPNLWQWQRLVEIAPENHSLPALLELGHADSYQIIAELSTAQKQAGL